MSDQNQWGPDRLRTPVDRAIHLEQRKAQLLPIVDDLRRLAREMEAAVHEFEAIEGDLPVQPWLRARSVVRPLFKAADDVEKAIADLARFNARYHRSYEQLPQKREEKRLEKARMKALKGGQEPQKIATTPSPEHEQTGNPQFGDVFKGLRKGA
ncbi:hypothetical protein MWG58_31310 (plasmid) [Streptomyces sp. WAC00276]|uniref:hypothetical protein n=1 Tax=Streptomyces sp. WAC00276 TaxID=2933778 RepID=UPI001FFFA7A5|nr:hypothetical protein [Streptomyces sp. WAC00276]MCK2145315.1 hypothetical protein [Streptomyces sp. WAC00276]